MVAHAVLPLEALLADGTGVRLLVRVRQSMPVQVVDVSEGLSTGFTRVVFAHWILAGICGALWDVFEPSLQEPNASAPHINTETGAIKNLASPHGQPRDTPTCNAAPATTTAAGGGGLAMATLATLTDMETASPSWLLREGG